MIGEVIGNFRVIARLGAGGMGEVFLAEHATIKTRVAIKLLRTSVSSDEALVQRFFNEAVAVSRIRHAGCAKIFDVGFHAGRAFLIMELLDGESLGSRLLRVGRLSAAEVADIGKQTAGVLEAVHAAGITHRDLKPDNIFLVPDRELARGERVKILDFGIAKLADATHGFTALTGPMGTPAYMAPEQWKNTAKVDWRADAYSLGCVAFEMASGKLPFEASSIPELCKKHLSDRPIPLRAIAPEQPAALELLVARLLAKQPADRPASMHEIAAAFERVATAPRHDTTLGSAASQVDRRRSRRVHRGALAAGGVALVGVAGVGLWAARSDVTLNVSTVAQAPITEVREARPAAVTPPPPAVTVNVETAPKPAPAARAKPAKKPKRIDPFADAPREREDDLIAPTDDDPETEARAHSRRGLQLFDRGAYAAAIVQFRAAYERMPLPGFLFNIAAAYDGLRDRTKALAHYKRYVAAVARGRAVADARKRIGELEH